MGCVSVGPIEAVAREDSLCSGFVERCQHGRLVRDRMVAVVHRTHGVFTHLYRVPDQDSRRRVEVHLAKVFAGHRLGEAAAWVDSTLRRPAVPAFQPTP